MQGSQKGGGCFAICTVVGFVVLVRLLFQSEDWRVELVGDGSFRLVHTSYWGWKRESGDVRYHEYQWEWQRKLQWVPLDEEVVMRINRIPVDDDTWER